MGNQNSSENQAPSTLHEEQENNPKSNLSGLVKKVAALQKDVDVLGRDPDGQKMALYVVLATARPLPPTPKDINAGLREGRAGMSSKLEKQSLQQIPQYPDHFIHPYTASSKIVKKGDEIRISSFFGANEDAPEAAMTKSEKKLPQGVSVVERPCLPEEPYSVFQSRIKKSKSGDMKESEQQIQDVAEACKVQLLSNGRVLVLVSFVKGIKPLKPDFRNSRALSPEEFDQLDSLLQSGLKSPPSQHSCDFELVAGPDQLDESINHENQILTSMKTFIRSKSPFLARYSQNYAVTITEETALRYETLIRDILEAKNAPKLSVKA
mmetsp:Transcript_4218/g.8378  ORF Transcript_4218/g.8378 Transcript_4218/m.8378 type:complete len:323 (+) Transcript_4218:63-1031(+)